jgi:hypothetical protein
MRKKNLEAILILEIKINLIKNKIKTIKKERVYSTISWPQKDLSRKEKNQ